MADPVLIPVMGLLVQIVDATAFRLKPEATNVWVEAGTHEWAVVPSASRLRQGSGGQVRRRMSEAGERYGEENYGEENGWAQRRLLDGRRLRRRPAVSGARP
jgi:hypothetical protein